MAAELLDDDELSAEINALRDTSARRTIRSLGDNSRRVLSDEEVAATLRAYLNLYANPEAHMLAAYLGVTNRAWLDYKAKKERR